MAFNGAMTPQPQDDSHASRHAHEPQSGRVPVTERALMAL